MVVEMEVMIPAPSAAAAPALDFNFNFDSAPSSPHRHPSFFYSAPTSPARLSSSYAAPDSLSSSPSAIPFHWEEKPGLPKPHLTSSSDDADFAFDFSGHLERTSLPADELFDGGKIKPLKPPPRFHYDHNRPLDSPKSPRKIVQAFSPRQRPKAFELDPFAAAMEHTRKENGTADRRGRERNSNPPSSSRKREKGSWRSLSPFRASDLLFDPVINHDEVSGTKSKNTASSLFSSSFWYKKWKIKDLLLFRSASESRAKDEEQLKKYSQLRRSGESDVKNSSFRSTESVGSVSSRRRSGPPISAHELHYTVNRAFSEEMRKRTTLPYKQGLLGCLGFINPEISSTSSSLSRA